MSDVKFFPEDWQCPLCHEEISFVPLTLTADDIDISDMLSMLKEVGHRARDRGIDDHRQVHVGSVDDIVGALAVEVDQVRRVAHQRQAAEVSA